MGLSGCKSESSAARFDLKMDRCDTSGFVSGGGDAYKVF